MYSEPLLFEEFIKKMTDYWVQLQNTSKEQKEQAQPSEEEDIIEYAV